MENKEDFIIGNFVRSDRSGLARPPLRPTHHPLDVPPALFQLRPVTMSTAPTLQAIRYTRGSLPVLLLLLMLLLPPLPLLVVELLLMLFFLRLRQSFDLREVMIW
jgi:hypothetical protein